MYIYRFDGITCRCHANRYHDWPVLVECEEIAERTYKCAITFANGDPEQYISDVGW